MKIKFVYKTVFYASLLLVVALGISGCSNNVNKNPEEDREKTSRRGQKSLLAPRPGSREDNGSAPRVGSLGKGSNLRKLPQKEAQKRMNAIQKALDGAEGRRVIKRLEETQEKELRLLESLGLAEKSEGSRQNARENLESTLVTVAKFISEHEGLPDAEQVRANYRACEREECMAVFIEAMEDKVGRSMTEEEVQVFEEAIDAGSEYTCFLLEVASKGSET